MPTPERYFRPENISDEVWKLECEVCINSLVSGYIREQRRRVAQGERQEIEQLGKVFDHALDGKTIVGEEEWLTSKERVEGLRTGSYEALMTEASLRIVRELMQSAPQDPFQN